MSGKTAFVQKAIKKYGDKYDYSDFEYKNCKSKSTIICKVHGPFQQTADNHIRQKNGCQKCAPKKQTKIITKTKMNKTVFIERAQKIHGNKYDYQKFIYVDMKTLGIIICPKHGEFLQKPKMHIGQKSKCQKCALEERRYTFEKFLEKANVIHENKYFYDEFVYVNSRTKSIVKCPEHGPFLISGQSHINLEHGCYKCGIQKYKKNKEHFIEKSKKIHGDKYDYSEFIYQTSITKGTIICANHGKFLQGSKSI